MGVQALRGWKKDWYLCRVKTKGALKKVMQWVNQTVRWFWKERRLRDILLFCVATVAFHFLYWNTDMDKWLFGTATEAVFDWFTIVAYKGSGFLLSHLSNLPFDSSGMTFAFYTIDAAGGKICFATMEIVHDCSAIKQLMQFLLVMLLCSGRLWKRLVYWLCGSVVLLGANIVRIYFLTMLFASRPSSFQAFHDWIARPAMYVVIFLLWLLWVEKFAYRKPKRETVPQKH